MPSPFMEINIKGMYKKILYSNLNYELFFSFCLMENYIHSSVEIRNF